jgi:hypothetical protein
MAQKIGFSQKKSNFYLKKSNFLPRRILYTKSGLQSWELGFFRGGRHFKKIYRKYDLFPKNLIFSQKNWIFSQKNIKNRIFSQKIRKKRNFSIGLSSMSSPRFFFYQIRVYFSNRKQMSIGTCHIPAGSSNPADKFRFAKSSLGLDGLMTTNVLLVTNMLHASVKLICFYYLKYWF